MVSGRNGVGFPIGPPSLWWAVGLEVGSAVCIYTWNSERGRVCVSDQVVFTEVLVERIRTHPESRTEG